MTASASSPRSSCSSARVAPCRMAASSRSEERRVGYGSELRSCPVGACQQSVLCGDGSGGGLVALLFFFQAEDGIRDRTVTGVQTCALPILIAALFLFITYRWWLWLFGVIIVPDDSIGVVTKKFVLFGSRRTLPDGRIIEIGRASCRVRERAAVVPGWCLPAVGAMW